MHFFDFILNNLFIFFDYIGIIFLGTYLYAHLIDLFVLQTILIALNIQINSTDDLLNRVHYVILSCCVFLFVFFYFNF